MSLLEMRINGAGRDAENAGPGQSRLPESVQEHCRLYQVRQAAETDTSSHTELGEVAPASSTKCKHGVFVQTNVPKGRVVKLLAGDSIFIHEGRAIHSCNPAML